MDKKYNKQLLNLAKQSIRFGLDNNAPLPIELTEFDPILREQRATFVTLKINEALRGCIGSLIAHKPLIVDLTFNAYRAAFSDTRFSPLKESEFDQLHFHISILTHPAPIKFKSEEDLIKQLRPNIDGLIMQDGNKSGTFLPSVWEQIPNPETFLKRLKVKAGLTQNYWSDNITMFRYEAEGIPS